MSSALSKVKLACRDNSGSARFGFGDLGRWPAALSSLLHAALELASRFRFKQIPLNSSSSRLRAHYSSNTWRRGTESTRRWGLPPRPSTGSRSEEHTSELQSLRHLV